MSKPVDTAIDYIVKLWPVGVALVGLVAWLVKVDNRTTDNSKTIARVERDWMQRLKELEIRLDERRKEDMGRIEGMFREIKDDLRGIRDR